jgi:hypothetical protein
MAVGGWDMQAGWIIGVARKTGWGIDTEEYGVAILDMTMALNAVRRLVGRAPEVHVWVKKPLAGKGGELTPGGIQRRDAAQDACCVAHSASDATETLILRSYRGLSPVSSRPHAREPVARWIPGTRPGMTTLALFGDWAHFCYFRFIAL